MGNSPLTCFRSRGKVRVVLLNGEVAEFKEPVRAATVMKKYPHHIILHCRMAHNRGTSGQRRKISVLGPEQVLKRKESYLLTSIQSTKTAKPFLDSWAFFTLSAAYNKKLNAKIRRRSSPSTRCWIQSVFDKIFQTGGQIREPLLSPLLSSRDEDTTEDVTKPLLGLDRPSASSGRDDLRDWRPSLQSIPESPSNSSSAQLSRSNSLFAGNLD